MEKGTFGKHFVNTWETFPNVPEPNSNIGRIRECKEMSVKTTQCCIIAPRTLTCFGAFRYVSAETLEFRDSTACFGSPRDILFWWKRKITLFLDVISNKQWSNSRIPYAKSSWGFFTTGFRSLWSESPLSRALRLSIALSVYSWRGGSDPFSPSLSAWPRMIYQSLGFVNKMTRNNHQEFCLLLLP